MPLIKGHSGKGRPRHGWVKEGKRYVMIKRVSTERKISGLRGRRRREIKYKFILCSMTTFYESILSHLLCLCILFASGDRIMKGHQCCLKWSLWNHNTIWSLYCLLYALKVIMGLVKVSVRNSLLIVLLVVQVKFLLQNG